jgi:hypothetical protein
MNATLLAANGILLEIWYEIEHRLIEAMGSLIETLSGLVETKGGHRVPPLQICP